MQVDIYTYVWESERLKVYYTDIHRHGACRTRYRRTFSQTVIDNRPLSFSWYIFNNFNVDINCVNISAYWWKRSISSLSCSQQPCRHAPTCTDLYGHRQNILFGIVGQCWPVSVQTRTDLNRYVRTRNARYEHVHR